MVWRVWSGLSMGRDLIWTFTKLQNVEPTRNQLELHLYFVCVHVCIHACVCVQGVIFYCMFYFYFMYAPECRWVSDDILSFSRDEEWIFNYLFILDRKWSYFSLHGVFNICLILVNICHSACRANLPPGNAIIQCCRYFASKEGQRRGINLRTNFWRYSTNTDRPWKSTVLPCKLTRGRRSA